MELNLPPKVLAVLESGEKADSRVIAHRIWEEYPEIRQYKNKWNEVLTEAQLSRYLGNVLDTLVRKGKLTCAKEMKPREYLKMENSDQETANIVDEIDNEPLLRRQAIFEAYQAQPALWQQKISKLKQARRDLEQAKLTIDRITQGDT